MKSLRSSCLALMLGAALPTCLIVPAQAQVTIDISAEVPPPPLPYYEQPVIPAEGYLWVPGYWAWDPGIGDYYWVPGTWVEPPQPELLWTPAYWGWIGGRYVFHPGYWGREVGFYGGIDYGYGYTGEGYFGGRWDHGAFFYNRTVNNITNVRITNVYNQTVVVNDTVGRVSFNGGNGGTRARPTAQQQAFAHQRHVEPTPAQRQQVEAASKDRALFSKQNHGVPTVAATPRPGALRGAGVTHASPTPVAAPNRELSRPEQPPRPGQETPHATAPNKGPLKPAERASPEQQRRGPQEPPKDEIRPQSRPASKTEERHPEERPTAQPPKYEERRLSPPPRAAHESPRRPEPMPRTAPAPHPPVAHPAAPRSPAGHPPAREEEKR